MKNLIMHTLFVMFLLIGCGSGYSDKSYEVEAPTSDYSDDYSKSYEEAEYEADAKQSRSADDIPSSPEAPGGAINIAQKIIKEAWVTIKVKDYKVSIAKVKKAVEAHQAYISKEGEYNSDYAIGNRLTIRVPKENLDTLIADIEKVAELVVSKNIEAKDVTEEYIDIAARLKTKKEVENRYIQLLKEARNVSDVINVERELKNIREEIESAEGRLKYLDNMDRLSSIYLEMNEDLPTVNNFRFFDKLVEGIGIGWKVLLNIIIGIMCVWPLVLIGVGLWLFFRRRIRRKRKQAKEKINQE